MSRDRATTNNEETMIGVGADKPPQSSRQAHIKQYYSEWPDSKLKFADLVLYFQDHVICAAEAGSVGPLDIIANVEPASSFLVNFKGK